MSSPINYSAFFSIKLFFVVLAIEHIFSFPFLAFALMPLVNLFILGRVKQNLEILTVCRYYFSVRRVYIGFGFRQLGSTCKITNNAKKSKKIILLKYNIMNKNFKTVV